MGLQGTFPNHPIGTTHNTQKDITKIKKVAHQNINGKSTK